MIESPDKLSRDIRAVLERPEAYTQEQLAQLAQRYKTLLEEVNGRLSRAHEWLRQGLRSEALSLIEQPPDALDAATHLCFGYAWPQWDELCRTNSVDGITAPDVTAASELSDAYDLELAAQDRLERHRLLALAHGPLRDRLRTLRDLQRLDPQNPVWPAQCQELEPLRHRELAAEVQAATQAQDAAALQRLHDEITRQPWLTPPPEKLGKAVAQALAGLRKAAAREAYEKLAAELHQAHGAQDTQVAAALVTRWAKLRKQVGHAPPADLTRDVQPVLDWLAHEQIEQQAAAEFQRDLARMEELLDEHAPVTVLEPLYEKLRRAEREIPRSLTTRYRSRLDEQQHRSRFRTRLVASVTVVVLGLAAVAVGWWIQEQNRRRELESWVVQLDRTIDQEDIPGTRQLLAEIERHHPHIFSHPDVVTRRSTFDKIIADDAARATELAALLAELSQTDPFDPNTTVLLDQATRLARHEEERLHVAKQKARITQARQDRQKTRDTAFENTLAELNDRYAEILAGELPAEERLRALDALLARYDEAIGATEASDELRSAAREQRRVIATDRDNRHRRARRAGEVQAALDRMTTDYRDIGQHVQRLRAFIDDFPEDPTAHVFEQVLAHEPVWIFIDTWNDAARAVVNKLPPRSETDIEQLEAALARLRAAGGRRVRPPAFLERIVSDLTAYSTRARRALDPQRAGTVRVQRFMKQDWVQELQTVQSTDGDLRYVLDGSVRVVAEKPPPPTYAVHGIVESLEALERDDARGQEIVRSASRPAFQRAALAIFASSAAEKLGKLPPGAWRTIHLELADKLLQRDDIDPVLRLDLGRVLIKWHLHEGWPVAPDNGALARFVERLDEAQFGGEELSYVNWPDTDSSQVAAARETAADLVRQAPDLRALVRDSDRAFAALDDLLEPWQCVGIAWTDERGQPVVRGAVPPGPMGTVQTDEAGHIVFKRCGARGEGGTRYDPGCEPALGTPLFPPPPWQKPAPDKERA